MNPTKRASKSRLPRMGGFARKSCNECGGVAGVIPTCKTCGGFGFRVVGPFDPIHADGSDELDREFLRLRQKSIGCELDAAVFRTLLSRVLHFVPSDHPLRAEVEEAFLARSCGEALAVELEELRKRERVE